MIERYGHYRVRSHFDKLGHTELAILDCARENKCYKNAAQLRNHEQSGKHKQMLAKARQQLCEEAGAAVDFRCPVFYPLTQEECRLKIKDVIEDELTIIGTVCGIVAVGMFVVMWLTWGAVTSLRSDAGDWDDWEGDE